MYHANKKIISFHCSIADDYDEIIAVFASTPLTKLAV